MASALLFDDALSKGLAWEAILPSHVGEDNSRASATAFKFADKAMPRAATTRVASTDAKGDDGARGTSGSGDSVSTAVSTAAVSHTKTPATVKDATSPPRVVGQEEAGRKMAAALETLTQHPPSHAPRLTLLGHVTCLERSESDDDVSTAAALSTPFGSLIADAAGNKAAVYDQLVKAKVDATLPAEPLEHVKKFARFLVPQRVAVLRFRSRITGVVVSLSGDNLHTVTQFSTTFTGAKRLHPQLILNGGPHPRTPPTSGSDASGVGSPGSDVSAATAGSASSEDAKPTVSSDRPPLVHIGARTGTTDPAPTRATAPSGGRATAEMLAAASGHDDWRIQLCIDPKDVVGSGSGREVITLYSECRALHDDSHDDDGRHSSECRVPDTELKNPWMGGRSRMPPRPSWELVHTATVHHALLESVDRARLSESERKVFDEHVDATQALLDVVVSTATLDPLFERPLLAMDLLTARALRDTVGLPESVQRLERAKERIAELLRRAPVGSLSKATSRAKLFVAQLDGGERPDSSAASSERSTVTEPHTRVDAFGSESFKTAVAAVAGRACSVHGDAAGSDATAGTKHPDIHRRLLAGNVVSAVVAAGLEGQHRVRGVPADKVSSTPGASNGGGMEIRPTSLSHAHDTRAGGGADEPVPASARRGAGATTLSELRAMFTTEAAADVMERISSERIKAEQWYRVLVQHALAIMTPDCDFVDVLDDVTHMEEALCTALGDTRTFLSRKFHVVGSKLGDDSPVVASIYRASSGKRGTDGHRRTCAMTWDIIRSVASCAAFRKLAPKLAAVAVVGHGRSGKSHLVRSVFGALDSWDNTPCKVTKVCLAACSTSGIVAVADTPGFDDVRTNTDDRDAILEVVSEAAVVIVTAPARTGVTTHTVQIVKQVLGANSNASVLLCLTEADELAAALVDEMSREDGLASAHDLGERIQEREFAATEEKARSVLLRNCGDSASRVTCKMTCLRDTALHPISVHTAMMATSALDNRDVLHWVETHTTTDMVRSTRPLSAGSSLTPGAGATAWDEVRCGTSWREAGNSGLSMSRSDDHLEKRRDASRTSRTSSVCSGLPLLRPRPASISSLGSMSSYHSSGGGAAAAAGAGALHT